MNPLTLPALDGLMVSLPDPKDLEKMWILRITPEGFKRSVVDFIHMLRDEDEEGSSESLERVFTNYYGHPPYED